MEDFHVVIDELKERGVDVVFEGSKKECQEWLKKKLSQHGYIITPISQIREKLEYLEQFEEEWE